MYTGVARGIHHGSVGFSYGGAPNDAGAATDVNKTEPDVAMTGTRKSLSLP